MKRTVLFAALVGLAFSGPAYAATIGFDGVQAPCLYAQTSAVTTQFASADGTQISTSGGAVMGACGNFGVEARSGSNFLALNKRAEGFGQQVEFNFSGNTVDRFSVWASGGFWDSVFNVDVYYGNGQMRSFQVFSGAGDYNLIACALFGITRVVIAGSSDYTVLDEFALDGAAIPEPASLSLLALGLAGAFVARRRR